MTNGGQPGVEDFEEGDILQLSDPNLAFEPGGTDGTISVPFDVELFSPGTDINAVHFVTADIQIGASSFQLKAGDLLMSTAGADATFTSTSTPGGGFTEPRRVYRRLQLLRGLEHEQIKSIFPRG